MRSLPHRSVCSQILLGYGIVFTIVSGCESRPAGRGAPDQRADSGAASIVSTAAQFRDVAEDAGIHFVPRNGQAAGHLTILESLGTGAALLDYDQDGLLDVFLPGGGEFTQTPEPIGLPAALFRNTGELKFSAVAAAAGVDSCAFYSHGACVGDVDSDGFPDLLVTG